MKIQDSLKIIVQAIPPRLRSEVGGMAEKHLKDLQEIRLRIGCQTTIVTASDTYYCGKKVERRDLTELVSAICNYSVYAKQNEILGGFITLRGGSRAGICGTAVYSGNNLINIRDISSVVLRVSNERLDCAKMILDKVAPTSGVLICGAPCSGKTTILRDMARLLSKEYRVSLIDTRGELAAVYGGNPQNDVGRADVLDGYPRSLGFDHAVRCLSPDIIICDEIGTDEDAAALAQAAICGVSTIASAHARNRDELVKKRFFSELSEKRVFGTVVFLESRKRAGEISEVCAFDELC